MKKLFMIAAMMVATLSANAQNALGEWSIKPMAGVNLATMTKADDSLPIVFFIPLITRLQIGVPNHNNA